MEFFNVKMNEKIASRVRSMPEDSEKIVKKRSENWGRIKKNIEKVFAPWLLMVFPEKLPE